MFVIAVTPEIPNSNVFFMGNLLLFFSDVRCFFRPVVDIFQEHPTRKLKQTLKVVPEANL